MARKISKKETEAPKTIAKRVKKKNLRRRELCVLRQYAENNEARAFGEVMGMVDIVRDDVFKELVAEASRLACCNKRARITFKEIQMAIRNTARQIRAARL